MTIATDILKPELVESWRSFNKPFEDEVPYMYLDEIGKVTFGVGNLIDPMGRALVVSWVTPSGEAATNDQVAAEWGRVKSMPKGLLYTRYHSPKGLHVTDSTIDNTIFRQLDDDVRVLAKEFPSLKDYPLEVQEAICSVAWAEGAGWPAKFPHAVAAIRAMEWACPQCLECRSKAEFSAHRISCQSAVAQLKIYEANDPGVDPRNWKTVDLLRKAAGATHSLE